MRDAEFEQISLERVAIIGIGLLGGSVAKALRRSVPGVRIHGISRRQSTRQKALDAGVVDDISETLEAGVRDCDVVVVATPVDRIADHVIQAAAAAPPACLITDVGSTKSGIVDAVARDPLAAAKFVAAHPIAGSERTGVENATADLFDGKVIVITPAESTTRHRCRQAESFWKSTGGRCVTMTPADHDQELACVSHVPHLMSALVARLVAPESLALVGSGWRDITRVAAGDPEMWTAICSENRAAIVDQLQACAGELSHLAELIRSADDPALQSWLEDAQQRRQQADS